MKYTSFILSFLVLILSVLTCSDKDACDESVTVHISQNHQHAQDQEDTCSPFCTCQCCGVSYSVALDSPVLPKHTFLGSFYWLFELPDNPQEYLHNIWHPPTLTV